MFNNLAKSDKTRIIAFIVMIALCITMIPVVSFGNDTVDNDVTKYVDISKIKVGVNGEEPKELPDGSTLELKKDDKVSFYFDWGVKNENMKFITSGAFFRVPLPESVIEFTTMSKQPLDGGLGTVQLIREKQQDGSYQSYLEVVFNENVGDAQDLTGGWLRADGKAREFKDGDHTGTIGSIVIDVEMYVPAEPVDKGPSDVGPDYWWGDRDITLFDKNFTWEGYKPYEGRASFQLRVNYGNYKKMLKGENYDKLKNVYITDEFPRGMTFKENTLRMYEYYPWIKADGTVTARDFISGTEITRFTLDENADQTKDNIHEFAKTVAVGKYAIWQNKGLVINYGDMPGTLETKKTWGEVVTTVSKAALTHEEIKYLRDDEKKAIKYENLTDEQKSFYESQGYVKYTKDKVDYMAIVTKHAISTEMKEATLDSFAKYYNASYTKDSTTGILTCSAIDANKKAPLLSFLVQFSTNVNNPGDGEPIVNTAYLNYNNTSEPGIAKGIEYVSFSGGVYKGLPGDVELVKYDGSTNAQLEGVQFKLQKYNNSTKEFEDIPEGNKGAGTFTTASGGALQVLDLNWGTYKFVEVKTLDGYKKEIAFVNDDFSQNGEFTIDSKTEGMIRISALNYKEDVKGTEVPPTSVLGEESSPEDDGSVLGEEAKTADMSNTMPILIVMLIAMAIILLASIQSAYRKE